MLKIISGGQTGADMGGLLAAQDLGINSGGWAAKGWRTEDGPNPGLADFGLIEHEKSNYMYRTEQNVLDSDITLIFGLIGETGSALTRDLCKRHGKDHKHIYWQEGWDNIYRVSRAFLINYNVINIAGNRESVNPGIQEFVRGYLVNVFQDN